MADVVRTKQDVVTVLHQHESRLSSLGVKRLALFGSFVRDEANANSDVDILVEFELGRKGFDNYMRLVCLLEQILGRSVKLVTTEALSPYLGPQILREAEYVTLNA